MGKEVFNSEPCPEMFFSGFMISAISWRDSRLPNAIYILISWWLRSKLYETWNSSVVGSYDRCCCDLENTNFVGKTTQGFVDIFDMYSKRREKYDHDLVIPLSPEVSGWDSGLIKKNHQRQKRPHHQGENPPRGEVPLLESMLLWGSDSRGKHHYRQEGLHRQGKGGGMLRSIWR